MDRPAGKAFLEYGGDLDVGKFGDRLCEIDNRIERMRKQIERMRRIIEKLRKRKAR